MESVTMASALKNARNRLRNGLRDLRCRYLPVLKARYFKGEFRPVVAYLHTERRCNLDCSYCVMPEDARGMTLETAKRSIDWLKTTGCRVIAITGGEPLLRKDFVLEIIEYAGSRGFLVELDTNGTFLDSEFIEKALLAGIDAVNLGIDTIEGTPGLPKNYKRVEAAFKALLRKKPEHGLDVSFDINVTGENIEDARRLTEVARYYGIGAGYHFKALSNDGARLLALGKENTCSEAREDMLSLLDWIIERKAAGYRVANSFGALKIMKGTVEGGNAASGPKEDRDSVIVRADGTFSPCSGNYSANLNYGRAFMPVIGKVQ